MGKGRERDPAPGGGDDDIEHRLGPRLVQHSVEAGADDGAGKVVFARPRLRPLGVEIDKADDGEPVDLPHGIEPVPAHRSTADEDDIHHPAFLPSGPSRPDVTAFTASP